MVYIIIKKDIICNMGAINCCGPNDEDNRGPMPTKIARPEGGAFNFPGKDVQGYETPMIYEMVHDKKAVLFVNVSSHAPHTETNYM